MVKNEIKSRLSDGSKIILVMDEKMRSQKVFDSYISEYKHHRFILNTEDKISIFENAYNIYLYSNKAMSYATSSERTQRREVRILLEKWLPDSIT
jgi:hypothetical protein